MKLTLTNCWTEEQRVVDVTWSQDAPDGDVEKSNATLMEFMSFLVGQHKHGPKKVAPTFSALEKMVCTFMLFDGERLNPDSLMQMLNGEYCTLMTLAEKIALEAFRAVSEPEKV